MFRSLQIFLVLSALLAPGAATAADWPQWRGADRTGVWDESGVIDEFPNDGLTPKWKIEIGPGYSGPTVADGRVYVMDRGLDGERAQQERVLCFDASTGDELWSHSYTAPYTISYRAGPRASVTIAEGRAFAVGAMGHFHCFDAETGEILWQRALAEDYQIRMPIWGIAGSPLVFEDLVIQQVGDPNGACIVAFDVATGQARWQALDDRASYSSPILIEQADQQVAVCWTGDSVSGLDPRSGTVLWRIPWEPREMPIGVATPVTDGEKLFVSSFYDGSLMLQLGQRDPTASILWKKVGRNEQNTAALHAMISTPVIKGDFVYGVDSYGQLRCLDAESGRRIWEDLTAVPEARWATIHIVRHGDHEWMLNDQGELIIATLSPKGFTEHDRAKLLERTTEQLPRRGGVTWSHPAFANRHIFARNDNQLICVPLSK